MPDLRCPSSNRLFAKTRDVDGAIYEVLGVEDNLIEIACRDCRNGHRVNGEDVMMVVHRFTLLGDCVETEVIA